MSRSWFVLPVAAGLSIGGLLSCLSKATDEDKCDRACKTARRCGLLPSALGGNAGSSQKANFEDCLDRCKASDGGANNVGGLLAILGNPELDSTDTLCRPDGLDACEELIEELDSNPSTSELAVTTTLTVRMTSAVSHASTVSLESWCCYDYDYDIYESPEDVFGDGVNEIEAIYDMIEPTYQCLTSTLLEAELAKSAINEENIRLAAEGEMALIGEDPAPDAARVHCQNILPLWPDAGMADGQICEYATKSNIAKSLEIRDTASSCNVEDVNNMVGGLEKLIRDWELDAGGLLIDGNGLVRQAVPDPDDPGADSIQSLIQHEIREEIDRPMGFLENACEELYEESGENACDDLVRGGALSADDCSGGPACSPVDCLSEDSECNRAQCDASISPPNRDCGYFGITEVRLGYRTDDGAEILGQPITDCSSRPQMTEVFENVRIGRLTPIAVVSGNLGASLTPEGDTVGDGSYSWYIEGTTRWVSAGESQLDLASPVLESFTYLYENPLEFLGWIQPRFPIGQACDSQPDLCESVFNDNCEDGIDNDGDGVGDSASPWCDELLGELVDRCVVSEPGRAIPSNCNFDPGDPFGDMPDPEDLPQPDSGEPTPFDEDDTFDDESTEGPPGTGSTGGSTMGPPTGGSSSSGGMSMGMTMSGGGSSGSSSSSGT